MLACDETSLVVVMLRFHREWVKGHTLRSAGVWTCLAVHRRGPSAMGRIFQSSTSQVVMTRLFVGVGKQTGRTQPITKALVDVPRCVLHASELSYGDTR